MNKEYTEEKLAEIEKNIISGIDQEINEEKELEELSLHISMHCIGKPYKYEFNGTEYTWFVVPNAYTPNGLGCKCFCYNNDKLKIVGPNKYIPATASYAYSKKDPDKQAAAAITIVSLLRHILGKDIEITEEDDE